jgi:hypothetical protein
MTNLLAIIIINVILTTYNRQGASESIVANGRPAPRKTGTGIRHHCLRGIVSIEIRGAIMLSTPKKSILRLSAVVALAALISGCHYHGYRGGPGYHGGQGFYGGPGYQGGYGGGYYGGPPPGYRGY